jgi:glycosyltransferase involved in cell wall biosynthesis
MSIQLSVVIITFNEERNIRRCLESVKEVADEILIVDSFSKDNTEAICLEYNTRFLKHPFTGHIEQKNYAIDQASFDWIISLDADEALTDELKHSILEVKKNPLFNGYRMNRLTNYCGKWVRFCGWYPDTKVRLVCKQHARWRGTNPHDRLDMRANEKTGFLMGDLLHYSYYTRGDHLKQIEYFGDIAAKEMFERGKRSGWLKIIIKVCAQFIKSFLLKKGFLDGYTGLTISRLSAYASYRKYKKLLDMRQNKNL